jgi:hypothetical protein
VFDQQLHSLAHDAEAAGGSPAFTELLHRSRVRRWRRRAGTGAAAVAAAGVIAAAAITVADVPNGPGPVHPGATEHDTHRDVTASRLLTKRYLIRHPVILVNQGDARMVDASYADRTHAAAVWEVCSARDLQGGCPDVLTWTSNGWRTAHALVVADKLEIQALADGSVVVWEGNGVGFLVSPDGTEHGLTVSAHPIDAVPGGDLVNVPSLNGTNPVGILNTATATVYPPLTPPTSTCLLDDQWDTQGTLWETTCDAGSVALAWTSNLGRTWSTHHSGGLPVVGMAVSGDRTAVLFGTGRPGRRYALGSVDITTDEGLTWRHVMVPAARWVTTVPPAVVAPYDIATTTDGQLFLSNGATLFKANRQWTRFRPVEPGKITSLGVTAGTRIVSAFAGSKAYVSTDGGQSWDIVTNLRPHSP